jgi:hypothetical protein
MLRIVYNLTAKAKNANNLRKLGVLCILAVKKGFGSPSINKGEAPEWLKFA